MNRPNLAFTLPIAHALLRILIIVNWVFGAGILALLISMLVAETWTFTALGVAAADISLLAAGLRVIPALGLIAIPLNYLVLQRLLTIIGTVRARDPFVMDNANRLQTIAWCLLVLQLLSMVIGGVATAISTPTTPIHLDAGFSITGWLAVLLTFVLARVFAEGARMREDLSGTV